jgi:hypothetical protein
MSSALFFENKKYISAKDASALTGYSQDYVGQLSRGNKVDSKKIGKVWYVNEESILNYKKLPSESALNSVKKVSEILVEKNSEVSPVSVVSVQSEIVKNTTETMVISDTRDALNSISRPSEDRYKKVPSKYVQFAHEVVFGIDGSLLKKLTPLALGLLLTLGVGTFGSDAT